MKKIQIAVLFLVLFFAFSASAATLSVKYKNGAVQNVQLNGNPSQITQITISEGEPAPHSGSGLIQVIAGSYGINCGASHGNKTQHLASQCNGKDQCNYTVDYRVIGDPAVGCGKEYIAEWRCGSGPTKSKKASAEAGFGSVIVLTCP
jgi:hypothetical protein